MPCPSVSPAVFDVDYAIGNVPLPRECFTLLLDAFARLAATRSGARHANPFLHPDAEKRAPLRIRR